MKPILLPLACLLAALPVVSAQTNLASRDALIIAAAEPAPAPQFNGASVIGVCAHTPVLYTLTVSGARPMEFAAKHLPAGLTLDAKTGIITGTLANKGEYTFTASAKNSAGRASAKIKIISGDTLALTPPLGWNSYDAFGDNVVESEMLANAHYVADKTAAVRLGHRRRGLLLVRPRRA